MLRYRGLLLFCLFILAGCSAAQTPPAEGVTPVDPPQPVEAVQLTAMDANPAGLHSWSGSMVLLAFGYTHCPDICPLTLGEFKLIKLGLQEQSSKVKFVFISVDGTRDSPARLTEYLEMFDSEFIGLTGDNESVTTVITGFGGKFIINDWGGLRENYTVDHTASKFLLDKQGRWIRTYAYGMDVPDITADIQQMLKR